MTTKAIGPEKASRLVTTIVTVREQGMRVNNGIGRTFGSFVDENIHAALACGDRIQSFTLTIDDNDWNLLEAGFHNDADTSVSD